MGSLADRIGREGVVEVTIQEKAAEAAQWFESAVRDDDEPDTTTFIRLKDGAPQWVSDLVFAAHHGWSDFMPDDYRYKWTLEALEYIAESDDPEDSAEFADQAVDVYTGNRFAWLSSNLQRASYCDEAAAEFGGGDTASDIVSMIGQGQYMEASEVYGLVLNALQDSL